MKIITNCKSTLEGNKLTITAELADKEFALPVTQVTVGHLSSTNPYHPRHVQISNEALFVKRMGNAQKQGASIAWLLDELVDVFITIDPLLTDPPVVRQQPTSDCLQVVVDSEIPYTTVVEESADAKTWIASNDKADALVSGKFYRMAVTNARGTTYSKAVRAPEPAKT